MKNCLVNLRKESFIITWRGNTSFSITRSYVIGVNPVRVFVDRTSELNLVEASLIQNRKSYCLNYRDRFGNKIIYETYNLKFFEEVLEWVS